MIIGSLTCFFCLYSFESGLFAHFVLIHICWIIVDIYELKGDLICNSFFLSCVFKKKKKKEMVPFCFRLRYCMIFRRENKLSVEEKKKMTRALIPDSNPGLGKRFTGIKAIGLMRYYTNSSAKIIFNL